MHIVEGKHLHERHATCHHCTKVLLYCYGTRRFKVYHSETSNKILIKVIFTQQCYNSYYLKPEK